MAQQDKGRLNIQTAFMHEKLSFRLPPLSVGFKNLIYTSKQGRLKKPVGRILESDTCSQNKTRTLLWPPVKCRIQESDLHEWCCQTAFIL